MQFTNSIAQEILALKQGGGGSGLDGPHEVPLAASIEMTYADLAVTGSLMYYIVSPAVPLEDPGYPRGGVFLGSINLGVVSTPKEPLDDPTMQYEWSRLAVGAVDTINTWDPPFYGGVSGSMPATCSVNLASFVVPNPAHLEVFLWEQDELSRVSVAVTNEWFLGSSETGTTTTVSASGFFFGNPVPAP
ncbi:MAG TPA: hypothetical protein VK054_09880 [Beutenbergiaceae bacterium]|nr:hypothetical protein [Beutenbergiaceae bacterium]